MTTVQACWFYSIFLLFAVFPVSADSPANANIRETIEPNSTRPATLRVANEMNCPRDTYSFDLTSDSKFVSIPEGSVQLSRSTDTQVPIVLNSHGLAEGVFIANVTLECTNCSDCKSSDKIVRVALTVAALQQPEGETEETNPGHLPEPKSNPVTTPNRVQIPDFTGLTLPDASDQLLVLGLKPILDNPSNVPSGLLTVIETQPAADATLDSGSRVKLIVGVPVPDLLGLSRDEAQARIGRIGLVLDWAVAETGSASSQQPMAGTVVPLASTVKLAIASTSQETRSTDTRVTVIIILLIIAFAVFVWRIRGGKATSPAAKFSLRSTPDAGHQEVQALTSERPRPVIRVRLLSDPGKQSLQGEPTSTTEKVF